MAVSAMHGSGEHRKIRNSLDTLDKIPLNARLMNQLSSTPKIDLNVVMCGEESCWKIKGGEEVIKKLALLMNIDYKSLRDEYLASIEGAFVKFRREMLCVANGTLCQSAPMASVTHNGDSPTFVPMTSAEEFLSNITKKAQLCAKNASSKAVSEESNASSPANASSDPEKVVNHQ